MFYISTVCTPAWEERTGRSSGSGDPQNNLNTITECQNGCIADATCVAIDINTGGSGCYFHRNIANLNDQRGTPAITQYVITRCGTGKITMLFYLLCSVLIYSGYPSFRSPYIHILISYMYM